MPQIIAQKTKVNSIEWKIAGALPAATGQVKALGVAGPVVGIHNNVLLVAGGANFPDGMPWNGGKKKFYNEVYAFQKSGDSVIHYKTLNIPFSIGYAAVCSTPLGILVAGGENENGLTNHVFLLQWNASSESIYLKELPGLPFAVTNASAVFHNGKIFVAGGERVNDVSTEFLTLDLNNPSIGWQKLSSLPKPLSHGVMVKQSNGNDDAIYLIGGRKRNLGSISNLYFSVLQYNVKTDRWSEEKELPYALSAGTGIATGNNQIFLFGGDAGDTFHKTESLIAAIGKETDDEKKKVLDEEKKVVQSTHPGFCKQIFSYNTKKKEWQKLDCIPFDLPVTTTAVQWNEDIIIPSGEIRAGVRTPQILIGKFK